MNLKTSRNPGGLVKDKPIALRLMPDELADAKLLAKARRQTESAMAREAYLIGAPLLKLQSPMEQEQA